MSKKPTNPKAEEYPLGKILAPLEVERVPLKEYTYPYKIYKITIHLVYNPIRKARFKEGIRTLNEFLRIAKRRGLEQQRSDHPIAFEARLVVPSRVSLKDYEIKEMVRKYIDLISDELFFHKNLFKFADFGIEVEYSFKPGDIEAEVIWSRDGITFTGEDLSRYIFRILP
jgi:hypothetical protein